MTTSQTTNLHLTKAVKGTNEPFSIDAINTNLDTIDAAIGDVDVAQDGSLQSQVMALGESVSPITKTYALRGCPIARLNSTAFGVLVDRPRGAIFTSASLSGTLNVAEYGGTDSTLSVSSIRVSGDSDTVDTYFIIFDVVSTSCQSGIISTICKLTVNYSY